jgi:hypothetical protein
VLGGLEIISRCHVVAERLRVNSAGGETGNSLALLFAHFLGAVCSVSP